MQEGETAEELTADALRNATYQHEFPKEGKAQLQDGKYEEAIEGVASKIHIALTDSIAFGDLNGDGINDAAVVLEASGGGSGTFRSLEAVINEGGAPVHVASALLGDRIHLEALTIEEGVITVQMVTHKRSDGMCCPTLRVVQRYQLTEGALQLLSQEELGSNDDS